MCSVNVRLPKWTILHHSWSKLHMVYNVHSFYIWLPEWILFSVLNYSSITTQAIALIKSLCCQYIKLLVDLCKHYKLNDLFLLSIFFSVITQATHDYKVGETITMRLMKRQKGTTYALPKALWEKRADGVLSSMTGTLYFYWNKWSY